MDSLILTFTINVLQRFSVARKAAFVYIYLIYDQKKFTEKRKLYFDKLTVNIP